MGRPGPATVPAVVARSAGWRGMTGPAGSRTVRDVNDHAGMTTFPSEGDLITRLWAEVAEGSVGGPSRRPELVVTGPTGLLPSAFAVEEVEQCQRLLRTLNDPELEAVALARMEGYSVEEIAQKLGYVARSVKRKLHLIRDIWQDEVAS